ncbi:cupin domain-containing protein [Arthrobacter sp. 2MCAF15]|uniref:cupin domain-containing protein n=1 Tax=Arthrobacter sp. 2MCAF15 TaxID=3232984 RepID=UPI003F8FB4FF
MEILPKPPTGVGPDQRFTGIWNFDVIRWDDRIRMLTLRFEPGVRTTWHSHALGQTILVTDGVGMVQSRGQMPVKVYPGQIIYTPPGEVHWHGAAPDHWASTVEMWETPYGPDLPETTWGEHVSDEDANGRLETRSP